MDRLPLQNLLVATRNRGKVAELQALLSELPIDLIGLSELPGIPEVEETGDTFRENSELKASQYAIQTGYAALADDSGLEVAALDNRPGVLSARYGGEDTPFAEKIVKLLGELEMAGGADRRARFVCSVAVADQKGQILFTSEGTCEGRLALEPRGFGGFGYDPIFVPDGFDQTFAELSPGVKNQISHRARAFGQIIPFLRDYNEI